MFAGHDHLLSELLHAERLLPAAAVQAAAKRAAESRKSLATVLIESGALMAEQVLGAVARHLGSATIDLSEHTFPADLLARVDGGVAQRQQIVPIAQDRTTLTVVAVDPLRPTLREEAAFVLGGEVALAVADPRQVLTLLARLYPEASGPEAAGASAPLVAEELTPADLQALAGQAPAVRLVNTVLEQAIRDGASDIHFEPFGDAFVIRCRIDGALHDYPSPPPAMALPVISRLKVLANLNIAERRLPQDGRIKLQLGGRAVDLRVSTLPTQQGESVVLRVLDQSAQRLDLGQLGLSATSQPALAAVIRRPNGILLVTGPTGSGKTTTLYSCLQELNAPEVKLLTIEDPVEYEIDGVMQVPVNPAAGLTFATALRSFLRQDPDIVMVGEIRDGETAQIAIQAALTGHLVLTTLHTNDAVSAVTRLIDMGIEPYLLAASVEAVVAQRLVRRLCRACKQAYEPGAAEWQALGEDISGPGGASLLATEEAKCREQACSHRKEPPLFYRAVGCGECHHTGYRGRLGLFEFWVLSERQRTMIAKGVSLEVLRRQARAEGLRTLREAGWDALTAGDTTVAEIVQAI